MTQGPKSWAAGSQRYVEGATADLPPGTPSKGPGGVMTFEEGEGGTDSALDGDAMLSTRRAADFLGLSPGTLANWRCSGTGPEFHKLGAKAVRYRVAALRRWRDGATQTNTAGGHRDRQ